MSNETIVKINNGSGAKDSRSLIDLMLSQRSKKIEAFEDAALIYNNKLAFSTDTYTISPEFFPGGDIGKLAICGTANDLSVRGAIPKWLSVACVIPEGYSINNLKEIFKSFYKTAEKANIQVVTGDTKVIDNKELKGLLINTSGIGVVKYNSSIRNTKPDYKIIVSGTVGDHSAAILALREGLFFEGLPPSDCAVLTGLVENIFKDNEDEKFFVRDATRGGIASVLYEIVENTDMSIFIDYNSIPIREEVKEFVNIIGLDPLTMANEGKVIVAVPSEKAETVLKLLKRHPLGKDASIIGEIKNGSGEVVINKNGVSSLLQEGTAIPRIC